MLRVEVVFATPDRQQLEELLVHPGATVADVVEQSGLRETFGEQISDSGAVGIWGKLAGSDQPVRDGDRIEIYRQLQMDPREARRRLALQGRSMNQGSGKARQ